ncbi:MAG: DUF5667 domain-containing protein [Patescibacteria group bacterium]|nr:DUF5667 domain-containing protein [Patescibacteria group bacterium]
MTEQELIAQINNLKTIQPDKTWKEQNREILYTQISNSAPQIAKTNIFVSSIVAVKEFFAQPSLALVIFLSVIIGGSIFGTSAFTAKPGDSLYIARVISEKAQLAITFGKEEKTKLEIKFANDRAKEIAQLLSEQNQNQADAEKLTSDFKKEINIVKTKIQQIKIADKTSTQNQEDTLQVFGANAQRDGQGIQISDSNNTTVANNTANTVSSSAPKNATSTPAEETHQKILREAQELFDQKDYTGAGDKIDEINSLIEQKETSAPADYSDTATGTN